MIKDESFDSDEQQRWYIADLNALANAYLSTCKKKTLERIIKKDISEIPEKWKYCPDHLRRVNNGWVFNTSAKASRSDNESSDEDTI